MGHSISCCKLLEHGIDSLKQFHIIKALFFESFFVQHLIRVTPLYHLSLCYIVLIISSSSSACLDPAIKEGIEVESYEASTVVVVDSHFMAAASNFHYQIVIKTSI